MNLEQGGAITQRHPCPHCWLRNSRLGRLAMQWFPDYSRWSSTRLRAIGRFLASSRLTCCCLALRQAGQLLPARGGHFQLGVFGIFLSRASAISPVASPLGGCGTFCTSVVKERCSPYPSDFVAVTSPSLGDALTAG